MLKSNSLVVILKKCESWLFEEFSVRPNWTRSRRRYSTSAFNFSFQKFCLILKDWFLIRFPPNFQERFLMSSASPEFLFWGPKIKQFCFKQV